MKITIPSKYSTSISQTESNFLIGSGSSTRMIINGISKNKDDDINYTCSFKCIEPYEYLPLEKLKVDVIKERVEKGESLNVLLPEVFACAREASKRTIKESKTKGYNLSKSFIVYTPFFSLSHSAASTAPVAKPFLFFASCFISILSISLS